MIALGGPKLKLHCPDAALNAVGVSMIALGGPKLKLVALSVTATVVLVSMIALGGPKLKQSRRYDLIYLKPRFNDSTGWA